MTPKELAEKLVAKGLDVNPALILQWPTGCVTEAKEWVTGKRSTVPDFLYSFDYQDRLPTQDTKPAKVVPKQRTMF